VVFGGLAEESVGELRQPFVSIALGAHANLFHEGPQLVLNPRRTGRNVAAFTPLSRDLQVMAAT
jgi:hypothetical protein